MAGWRAFLPGGVCGFLLGLIVGTLWTFYPFSFDNTLSLSDVLRFLTAILIAFVLQQVLQERYRNLRTEKDLLIDSAKEAQVTAAEAYKLCYRAFINGKIGEEDNLRIIGSFRLLSNSITNLESLSKECALSIDPETFQQIKQASLSFKRQATGKTYPNKPYKMTDIKKQGEASRHFHDRMNRFIIEVNRAHRGKKSS